MQYLGWETPSIVQGAYKHVRIPSQGDGSGMLYRLWTGGAYGTEYFLAKPGHITDLMHTCPPRD